MGVLGVIVLAGGGATRMGGVPKPALVVAGVRLIDRVLAAATPLGPVVVVAPPDLPLPPDVRRTREDPPGAGPVAALAAGLSALAGPAAPERAHASDALAGRSRPEPAGLPDTLVPPARLDEPAGLPDTLGPPDALGPPDTLGPPARLEPVDAPDGFGPGRPGLTDALADRSAADCVVLLGGDLPMITTGDLRRLVACLDEHDAAAFVDGDGRAQWMCSVWRWAPLAAQLRNIAANPERTRGPSIRALSRDLRLVLVESPGEPRAGSRLPPWFDCDTEDDLRRAEEWLCR